MISRPTIPAAGITHALAAIPSTSTVHAPHSPRPQPYLGLFKPQSLRKTLSSDVPEEHTNACSLPLTLIRVLNMVPILKMCVCHISSGAARAARYANQHDTKGSSIHAARHRSVSTHPYCHQTGSALFQVHTRDPLLAPQNAGFAQTKLNSRPDV
jgi:hypothetical protein